MDTFENAIKIITKNCYMASIDLRHAYYSVPVATDIKSFYVFNGKEKVINTLACQMEFPPLLDCLQS